VNATKEQGEIERRRNGPRRRRATAEQLWNK